VPTDLADSVDYVLANLLCQLHELLLGELMQVFGTVDLIQQARPRRRMRAGLAFCAVALGLGLATHEVRVYMKSTTCSSSRVA
jgi:hypothetical protein